MMEDWREIRNRKWYAICILFFFFLALVGAAWRWEEEPEMGIQKTQIEVWYYWDLPYTRNGIKKITEKFNKSQANVEVILRYVPDEDFKKQLALSIADGTMPEIAIMDSSDFKYFNSMEPFVDLTEVIGERDQYREIALSSCTVDNRLLGLPLGLNSLALYYNRELLAADEVEVPQNWEEFRAAAKKLTHDGRYGCAFPALQSEESAFCILPLIWTEGGNGEFSVSAMRYAFELLKDLVDSGAMSREMTGMTMGDIARAFSKGEIAMMFCTTIAAEDIRLENQELDFGVAMVPARQEHISVAGGEVLGVIDGEHQEAALEFVRYLADVEHMKEYIGDLGYLAPRQDVLEWQMEQNPMIREYEAILQTAKTREFTVRWPQISVILSEAVGKIMVGEEVDSVLEELERRMKQVWIPAFEGDRP